MTENEKFCPGCGRHCDLSAPSCGRGEEYARTGVMPERREQAGPEGRHGPEGHHGPHEHHSPHDPEGHGPKGHHGPGPHGPEHHGPHGRRIDPEQYAKLDTDGKILAMLHALGHESRHRLEREGTMLQREQTQRPEFFEALTDEEKQTLLATLEKLHASWSRKPEHPEHGHGHARAEE